jgi:hypothetical protein
MSSEREEVDETTPRVRNDLPTVTAGPCGARGCSGQFLITGENDLSPLAELVTVECTADDCDWTMTVSSESVANARAKARSSSETT